MQRIPEVWPGWQADELIGQGAYGKVYKASRTVNGLTTRAAIKVIDIPRDETEVSSLRQMGMDALSIRSYFEETAQSVMGELAIMDALKGAPSVVGIEDYQLLEREGGVGWTVFIRMELLEDLPSYQERNGMPSPQEAARLGVDVCRALGFCHSVGIVHRDVKPENVFHSDFGGYKLGDYGLARRIDEGSRSTKSQAGSGPFMAPEVMTGHYDARVDIYSLGVMLYRYLNGGKPPFIAATETPSRAQLDRAQQRRLTGERPPLPAGEGVDSALAAIAWRAVEPRPEDRWQSADEFGKALQAWLDGAPPEVKVPKDLGKVEKDDGGTIEILTGVGEGHSHDNPVRLRDVDVDAIPDQRWEGEPVCPDVALFYNGARLVSGTDFTASYSDNDEPGTAAVVLRGVGRFTGQRTLHFEIVGEAGGKGPVADEDYARRLEAVAKDYIEANVLPKIHGPLFRLSGNAYVVEDGRDENNWKTNVKKARRSIGIGSGETVYLLHDTAFNLISMGKRWLALCTTGLYYNPDGTGRYMSWDEFRSIPTSSISLTGNGMQIGGVSLARNSASKKMVEWLCGLHDELAKVKPNSKPTTPPRKRQEFVEIEAEENGETVRVYGYRTVVDEDAGDTVDEGPVKREYPAVPTAKQADAIARNYLRNYADVWRPNPEREYCDPLTDLVYETLFKGEISAAQGDAVRSALGIGLSDTIYLLWDKHVSSLFKSVDESLVLCDTGLYYRSAEKTGRMSWEEFRELPAADIHCGGDVLVVGGITLRCGDAGALMMVLQRLRSELVYARHYPDRDELAFEAPTPKARAAAAAKAARRFLVDQASEGIVHVQTEFCDEDEYEESVRRRLDIPEDEDVYVAYAWDYDSDNTMPDMNRELPPSFGAFACTERGLYTEVDDGESSHTRLVEWGEFNDFIRRDGVASPDGRNSILIDNWLFGNIGEGVNIYPNLFRDLLGVLGGVS